MKELLEPMIEKRVADVTEVCCQVEESVKLYELYIGILDDLKTVLPSDSHYLISDLESTYNQNSGVMISHSYKSGFLDGLNLVRCIREY